MRGQNPSCNAGLADFRWGGRRLFLRSTAHDQREGHQYEHPPEQRDQGICRPREPRQGNPHHRTSPSRRRARGWNEVVVGDLIARIRTIRYFLHYRHNPFQLLTQAVALRLVNLRVLRSPKPVGGNVHRAEAVLFHTSSSHNLVSDRLPITARNGWPIRIGSIRVFLRGTYGAFAGALEKLTSGG